ncbi:hypothetical protein HW532_08565 [Kaustia mangrovi]|uniref:RiboL-PSP-HEPN domain-containing protein n=1 Tax=Kaustia mangrovi TaxID=2593653 RepID=A0A7S8C3M4_9HYPH|nr:HEPN domain-containing protein [Kaustia mangrovi]QPC42746.1 hypothetical protein HW532_08565 [Kaustia mangrovi]
MPSQAFNVFNRRKKREVLEIADVFQDINNRPGPNTKYSLLNGALVLLISSWEVYCEDVCRQVAAKIHARPSLRFSQLDEKLRKDLVQYAGNQYKGNQDPLLEKVAMLPDGGWRDLLADRLNDYIPDFNTPKFVRQRGKDLNGLFRQVLGIKMSRAIEEFVEDEGLCERLDAVVTLRGEIAHTGDAQAEDRLSPDILRQHTASFIEAAAAVDVITHQEFRGKLGFAPWQITQPIRDALRQVARDKL